MLLYPAILLFVAIVCEVTMERYPYDHISIIIMPTDNCNMNCVYCFNSRRKQSHKYMNAETMEKIFRISTPFYKEITFIWHGGEPLLMGLEFYKNAVRLQKEINTNNSVINNHIQTNLTLLSDDIIDFFVKEKFHVGSSFDGISSNEFTRHNTDLIIQKHQLLKERGGKNGFICVVQSKNVDHLIEDYEWFKKNRINYSVNPYITSLTNEEDPLFVSSEKYVSAVAKLFDHWLYDTSGKINISSFMDFVDYILWGRKNLCCYNSCMGKHIGICYDGSIFNCNRDFPSEFCFGDIHSYNDIHQCFESEGFISLLKGAIDRRKKCAENCEIFSFCAGGCNHCALVGGSVYDPNQYVCDIIKGLYHHIEQNMKEICAMDILVLEGRINQQIVNRIKEYRNNKKHSNS